MNRHEYGYGAPHGFPAYPPPPTDLYVGAQAPLDRTLSQTAPNENVTAASYEYNRNVIPGLGLSFSHSTAPVQTAQINSSSASSFPVAPTPNTHSAEPKMYDTARSVHQQSSAAASPMADDAMEEGELSEGELEDLYEPRDSEGRGSPHPETTSGLDMRSQVASKQLEHSALTARERSGSYSPYLSPNEVDTRSQSHDEPQESLTSLHALAAVDNTSASSGPDSNSVQTSRHHTEAPRTITIAEAKQEAQDAISRLWPLKIRYQDYLKEGVDELLLKELFQSLGLNIEVSPALNPPAAPVRQALSLDGADDLENAEKVPPPRAGTEGAQGEQEKKPEEPRKAGDPSEERKDRIARLLALKGSKPPASEPIERPKSTPPSNAPPAAKSLSKNTKLLQQKMEALLKSREAMAQKDHPSNDNHTGADGDSQVVVAVDSNNAYSTEPPNEEPSDAYIGSASDESTEAQPTPPIPGLFLSSSQLASRTAKQQKRPIASDLNDLSGPSKRPFGQKRGSQPFLIDVSDDEDEMEMDIDSPEQHSASLHMPATPAFKPSLARNPSGSLESAIRQISSPTSVSTPLPTGPSTHAGRPNLQSMNKMIEEMKRKIAEAEARKRAKSSRPGSATPSGLNGQVLTDSEASPIPNPPAEITPPLAEISEQLTQMVPVECSVEETTVSARLPKPSDLKTKSNRRSRSRAASERLSLIEAHRREQLSKLQALRSQMASIEKDIEDSLQEETKLKEDALDESPSDSEDEAEQLGLSMLMETPIPKGDGSPDAGGMQLNSDSPDSKTEQTPMTESRQSVEIEPTTTQDHTVPQHAIFQAPEGANEQLLQESLQHTSASDMIQPEENPVETDVAMADLDETGQQSSSSEGEDMDQDDTEESSDDYEPPEATSSEQSPNPVPKSTSPSLDPTVQIVGTESEDSELQAPPLTQQVSSQRGEPGPEANREGHEDRHANSNALPTGLMPYVSPLRYFRSYRFHPQYKQSVPGGLRSLTYSNKIDALKELCPEQSSGQECPRGDDCQFQHFEKMQVPDSQIITQLLEYRGHEAEMKQEYVTGLRDVLTDLRNRKIKDLDAIGQGIIEFRAKFHGDESKILPLDGVSI